MNKIKDLRMYRNLTIEELAYQIGVPAEKIVKWENGEERPTDREIILLSSFFHCTPQYLLGLEESMNESADYIDVENAKPFARPIMCPHCGSRSLSFVAEYHKDFHSRMWSLIALTAGIILLFFTVKYEFDMNYLLATIFCFIAYVLFHIKIIFTETRTHVKSICRDCGHIWLLD